MSEQKIEHDYRLHGDDIYNALISTFRYDPDSGFFYRKSTNNRAESNGSRGYLTIYLLGKNRKAHRMAWLYMNKKIPDMTIDHINHDKRDNRICNLRVCEQIHNTKNCKISRNNTSGVNGVSWDKERNKWAAYINHKFKKIHLGRFSEKTEAITARELAEKKYEYHENHGL